MKTIDFAEALWVFDDAVIDTMLEQAEGFLRDRKICPDPEIDESIPEVEKIRNVLQKEMNENRFDIEGPDDSELRHRRQPRRPRRHHG